MWQFSRDVDYEWVVEKSNLTILVQFAVVVNVAVNDRDTK